MKRFRLLILLTIATTALLGLMPGGIAAATGTTTVTDVQIEPNAAYDNVGAILHVELKVRCQGGTGTVLVDVEQSPPETAYPLAFGSGPNAVVCDGRTHEVAVTVLGEGFDAGRAFATAQVIAPSGTDVTERCIDIRVV